MLTTITFVLVLTCTTNFNVFPTKADELKTYIVHLSPPEGQEFFHPHKLEKWYRSFLSKVSDSNEKPKMVHTYQHVITGFAAKMSVEQANMMENLSEEVLYVTLESVYQLHTTRSPQFLGLHQNSGLWKDSKYGKGIIIGVLDSGITPGHPSFDDKGIPPPPPTWKGKCEVAGCNNKLIGMRSFVNGSSPIDKDGHGTHTSSTAAGSPVDNANVLGYANGTATGMAPLAHLAIYKVCSLNICSTSDILAGMDAAIGEGVNVLSLSFGGPPEPFYNDVLAIGAYTAIKKGIFVSSAAGNDGPMNTTVSNGAPWMLTVGASTIDRRIMMTVHLGNNKTLDVESLYQPNNFEEKFRSLIHPGKNGCTEESLSHIDVKGKVVLCDFANGEVVKKNEGAAMILVKVDITCGKDTRALSHVLPASQVGYKEGVEIKKYLNSTSLPIASIVQRGTVLGVKSAPEVSCDSSRGPNAVSPGILKPDVIGPGVNILAAWIVDDKTETKNAFKFDSGTSMSCPHLAGIAALLKSAHPEWSPAAIKSAIMTTASQVNRNNDPIIDFKLGLSADVFAMGSGHVNPSKANNPGLIFDIEPDDYIPYLCGLGYSLKNIEMIVKKKVSCSETIPEAQLNYPSLSVVLKRGDRKTYTRTVTNVGKANSTYTVDGTSVPSGVGIEVENFSLRFTGVHQKLSYKVTFFRFSWDRTVKGSYGQGHMTWVCDKYSVRTPISVKFE